MKKRKIALYGKSGSGKDFLLNALSTMEFAVDDDISEVLRLRVSRFAFADNVKRHIQLLLGLKEEDFDRYLNDECYKNHTLVDVAGMSIAAEADNGHKHPGWRDAMTAESLDKFYKAGITIDDFGGTKPVYMSLREFTVFYGTNIMQRYLGKGAWCLSMVNSQEYREAEADKERLVVVTDCRFPYEYKFLRERGFKFVEVTDRNNEYGMIDNVAERYYGTFEPDFVFSNDKQNADNFDRELSRFLEWLSS